MDGMMFTRLLVPLDRSRCSLRLSTDA